MTWSSKTAKETVENEWLKHSRGSNHSFFPIDLGFPYRIKGIPDEKQFLRRIWENVDSRDIYCGVYDRLSIKSMKFDKIYIDIDSDPYRVNLKIPKLIVKHVESKYGGRPRVNYSGCKGWHIYIDFGSKLNLKYTESLRLFVLNIVSKLKINLEEIDTSVLGDKERISRLPFTPNYGNTLLSLPRAPRLCIPVDTDWSLSDVEYESQFCSFRKRVEICPVDERELESELLSLDKIVEARRRQLAEIPYKSFPEVAEENLRKLAAIASKVKGGRHRLLFFMIIPRLIEIGKSTPEIHGFCKEFIETTGGDYTKYIDYVDRCVVRNRLGPDGDGKQPWKALSWEHFFLENLDVLEYFSQEKPEG